MAKNKKTPNPPTNLTLNPGVVYWAERIIELRNLKGMVNLVEILISEEYERRGGVIKFTDMTSGNLQQSTESEAIPETAEIHSASSKQRSEAAGLLDVVGDSPDQPPKS